MEPGTIFVLENAGDVGDKDDPYWAVLSCPNCGQLGLVTRKQMAGLVPVICGSDKCPAQFFIRDEANCVAEGQLARTRGIDSRGWYAATASMAVGASACASQVSALNGGTTCGRAFVCSRLEPPWPKNRRWNDRQREQYHGHQRHLPPRADPTPATAAPVDGASRSRPESAAHTSHPIQKLDRRARTPTETRLTHLWARGATA